MVALVFIIILGVAVLTALVVGIFARESEVKIGGFGFAGVFLAILAIVWISNSIVYVEKRVVGIVIEFGKPTETLDSGVAWVAPWAELAEFPTTNQSIDLNGTDGGDSVALKFDGGGSGWANQNAVWQIESKEKAVSLWENWKEFDKVGQNVVRPALIEVTAAVIGAEDPKEAVKSSNLVRYGTQIKDKLSERLSKYGIRIEQINMIRVDVDQTIQERINRQVAAVADVERSKTEQERARIDNETNALRQQSLTPNALVRECLDVTNRWNVQQNGPLSTAWNCFAMPGLVLGK